MKLLLDTVVFLRAILDKDLSPRAVQLLTDVENERYLSAVSSWEICIKYSKGRLRLPEIPEHFIPKHRHQLAAEELPLDEESVLHVTRLPQFGQVRSISSALDVLEVPVVMWLIVLLFLAEIIRQMPQNCGGVSRTAFKRCNAT